MFQLSQIFELLNTRSVVVFSVTAAPRGVSYPPL